MSINFTVGTHIADIFSPDGKHMKNVYIQDADDCKKNATCLDKIRINDETNFFPAISDYESDEQVDRVYVCGETGCGKSSFIREYVFKFLKQYKKATILLFSSKKEDKQLDDIKQIIRVPIDDDIYNNPYTLTEISSNSKPVLAIFDDIEDFKNKKINKEIERLRDEILRNGRSYAIYSIFVHHNPTDYKATRNQIFEANKIVIFPRRSGKSTYNYLMDKKLLLSKEIMDMVNTLKSTFVCISKQNPKCIISNKYIIVA